METVVQKIGKIVDVIYDVVVPLLMVFTSALMFFGLLFIPKKDGVIYYLHMTPHLDDLRFIILVDLFLGMIVILGYYVERKVWQATCFLIGLILMAGCLFVY